MPKQVAHRLVNQKQRKLLWWDLNQRYPARSQKRNRQPQDMEPSKDCTSKSVGWVVCPICKSVYGEKSATHTTKFLQVQHGKGNKPKLCAHVDHDPYLFAGNPKLSCRIALRKHWCRSVCKSSVCTTFPCKKPSEIPGDRNQQIHSKAVYTRCIPDELREFYNETENVSLSGSSKW